MFVPLGKPVRRAGNEETGSVFGGGATRWNSAAFGIMRFRPPTPRCTENPTRARVYQGILANAGRVGEWEGSPGGNGTARNE